MMKNPLLCSFVLTMAAAALPLAAQTTPPATHRPATAAGATAVHHAAGGCVTTPTLSPKIPALPASAPCAKTLYTVTRAAEMKLDYASPLVSPAVREELGGGASTFSLNYVDTKTGTGDPVEAHKCLSVHYTGYLVDGTKFDSSHDHPDGQPIAFQYGAHHVIPGWDTGFEGMRMGGERRLFIPYQLAYGEAGKGPIPPRAELIFDVEPISQGDPRAGAPPGGECMKSPPPGARRPGMPPAGAAPKGPATPPAGSPPAGTPPPASTPQGSSAKPQR
jgi:peptidylprolyl isomerase